MSIFKYNIPANSGVHTLLLPEGSQILSAAVQFPGDGEFQVWVRIPNEEGIRKRAYDLCVCMTGSGTDYQMQDGKGRFIGTVLLSGGHFVLHVFEMARPNE